MAKRTRCYDKRLYVALSMPKLPRENSDRNQYNPKRDKVFQWLSQQPEMMNYLFDLIARIGIIVYDKDTGTWHGADYDGN